MSAAHTTPVHHLRDEQLHRAAEELQAKLIGAGAHRDAMLVIELSIRWARVAPESMRAAEEVAHG